MAGAWASVFLALPMRPTHSVLSLVAWNQPTALKEAVRVTHLPVCFAPSLSHKSRAKMVLLTVTSSIVEGLQILSSACSEETSVLSLGNPLEPSLQDAAIGNPISHAQVVDLWKALKRGGRREYTLERLLKGSFVYVPPPPPKPEPVSCNCSSGGHLLPC